MSQIKLTFKQLKKIIQETIDANIMENENTHKFFQKELGLPVTGKSPINNNKIMNNLVNDEFDEDEYSPEGNYVVELKFKDSIPQNVYLMINMINKQYGGEQYGLEGTDDEGNTVLTFVYDTEGQAQTASDEIESEIGTIADISPAMQF